MSRVNQSRTRSWSMYMNPFEMVGYVALGFVPTIMAMKIGWDLARKKIPKRDETYSTADPTALNARN